MYHHYTFSAQMCVNLTTLEWSYKPVKGMPPLITRQHQVNLKFAQLGDTVYCLNAFDSLQHSRVIKNQLWALHLPTLTLTKLNDGPCGRVQVRVLLGGKQSVLKGELESLN